jgi:aminopeptidase N
VLLLTVGVLLTSASARGHARLHNMESAARAGNISTVLHGLMVQAVAAANSHQPDAFAPLTADDAARLFDWANSHTSVWQGDVLTVPAASDDRNAAQSPTYLAVFHAWHTCESDGDHVHRLVQTAQGWQLGPEIPETDTGGFRMRDHDLHVTLDVPHKAAQITDLVRIERTAADVPDFALLRLSQDFHVTKLALEGPDGAAVPFQQVGGLLAFTPPAAKTFSLFLQYAGVVEHQGSDYITANEATLDSYWYPHIARLPATAAVTVTVPPGWEAIAPGERIKEQRAADGSLTVTYRNQVPVSFLTLDAGRYTITRRVVKNRTLSTYFLKPDAALSRRCLDQLEHALTFYEAHFGPFPYTRYAIVQTEGAFTGALEAYSFATFGPHTLPSSIAHELSHTWWGGLIPCTYTHAMWNEAFAEYSDALFQRLAEAGQAHPDGIIHPQRPVLTPSLFPIPIARASDSSDDAQCASAYGKGPRVLRALEAQLGQETMLRCLTAFVATHSRSAPAEWSDFEAVVRQVTGQDYHWFFTQWLERPGLPAVWLADVTAQPAGNGQILVTGEIRQDNNAYRLSMPLALELRDGSRVTQTVEVQEARTPFHLRVNAPPARLTLDPTAALPLALPPDTPPNADLLSYEFPLSTAQREQGRGKREEREADLTSGYPPTLRERKDSGLELVSAGHTARSALQRRVLTHRVLFHRKQEAPDLDVFLYRAAKLVNQGRRTDFAALSDPAAHNDVTWVGTPSALPADDPANTRPWRVLRLALPAVPKTLIVFTKYHPCESDGDHVFPLIQTGSQWRLGSEIAEAAPEGIRLRSHQVRITLEPHTGTLHAADRITLAPDQGQSDLSAHGLFLLRLGDGYVVDRLQIAGHPAWFRQAGGVIAVRLSSALLGTASVGTTTLEIAYHGQAAQSGEDFITPAETALSGYWLPQIGRLPVSYDVALTVPRDWMAFTQGVVVGKKQGPGQTAVTFTYHNALPISFPSLAAGPFHLLSHPPAQGDSFGISVAYLHAHDAALARSAYRTTAAALHFYAGHFASFPYPRFTVVISDRYRMALEGYSMTTVARSYVPNVLPHEISHTWWGGIVPNTYLQDMWNESFAEYSDGLYGRVTGRNDSLHNLETAGMLAMGMTDQMGELSLREAHDALDIGQSLIGYMKGSLVLETLEAMLGQARMLACMHTLVVEHPHGEAATWDDFVRAVTDTAGPDWKGFFDAWLPTRGVPRLHLEDVKVEQQEDRQQIVTAEIAQAGDTAYWLDVPVELRLKDGTAHSLTIPLKSAHAAIRFQIPANASPEALEIDPQKKLLRASTPTRTTPTLTELLARGEPLHVIYGTGGTPEERKAMREAATAAEDLFPFSKVTLQSDAQALADAKPPAAADVLAIGRPENNQFLAAYAPLLPVQFSTGASPSLILGAQTFTASDVWMFAATSMTLPGHEDHNLLVFAGLSADSMRRLADVRSLPGMDSVYVAEGEGKVLASRGPISAASTVYHFGMPEKP